MICILLSTFNGEKYLEEQLNSLKNQERIELKILIRDDGSKDRTIEIIKQWKSNYPLLIDYIQGENIGFAKSFTSLLQIAVEKYPDAEYYAFCDQDDVWLPEKLYEAKLLLNSRVQNQSCDVPVCYASNLIIVDEKLNIIKKLLINKVVSINKLNGLLDDYCTGCTMVFNKAAVELYIGQKHKYLKYHDKLLGMICLFMGELIYDNRSFIMYRQHGKNQVGANTSNIRIITNSINRLLHNRDSYLLPFVADFVDSYKTVLKNNDIFDLLKVLYYKDKISCKLSLFFDRKIHSTSFFKTIRLKAKILFNKLQ